MRHGDENPVRAVGLGRHQELPHFLRKSRHEGARNRSTRASRARKSEQAPPNPEQGCFHCRTPEPTAGPSSCMCRWCAHKKSREKVPSGSRAAVRKSLGRVRLIYPLQYPGKMACFGWPADSELEAPSGHALKHVAARPHAVYALTYDMAMRWHGYLQRWSAWVCLGRSPTSTSPFCVVGTHHALPQAAVHAILFPHARTTSQDYR